MLAATDRDRLHQRNRGSLGEHRGNAVSGDALASAPTWLPRGSEQAKAPLIAGPSSLSMRYSNSSLCVSSA